MFLLRNTHSWLTEAIQMELFAKGFKDLSLDKTVAFGAVRAKELVVMLFAIRLVFVLVELQTTKQKHQYAYAEAHRFIRALETAADLISSERFGTFSADEAFGMPSLTQGSNVGPLNHVGAGTAGRAEATTRQNTGSMRKGDLSTKEIESAQCCNSLKLRVEIIFTEKFAIPLNEWFGCKRGTKQQSEPKSTNLNTHETKRRHQPGARGTWNSRNGQYETSCLWPPQTCP